MELGMVGLGRMGANMAARLLQAGHAVTGFDAQADAREAASARGIGTAGSLAALVESIPAPRAIWLMVPAGAAVDGVLEELLPLLEPGDVVVDGGNSRYRDSQRRAGQVTAAGCQWLDVGTSGGVHGLEHGYCMTIGGDTGVVERLRPVFQALAPSPDSGWGHVGPAGAGHYAKMIHNGIEYGLMQAYAEGMALLHRREDLAPDPAQIARIWSDGSVIRSWLLELTAGALEADPKLSAIAPYVADSGEGRWTVAEALELDVPAPVITQAMIARLRSRDGEGFGDRVVAALRDAFGGHGTKSG
ncbi:phosphogluconate dehydrogenase (NAD(+)-dependent, decarboxylating) [Luteimonas dalianensis]|uniref:phosphogluconate dehydrogenase (NAD(+)-dependent, decarboxylating) n=1 Tax=Luteimonas dalianensis TaxID=1148196 RepID=UPI003BF303B8